MFKVGDKVRIQTKETLAKRYAEKNKISIEVAGRKISDYCRNGYKRGLVMKKNEAPFNNIKYCGKEGKITDISKYFITIAVIFQEEQYKGYGQKPELALMTRHHSFPPSCVLRCDYQMEFVFD